MAKKQLPRVELTLDRIISGGQTIGTLESGQKCLVWGGLPKEKVVVQVTKKKSSYIEGYVTEVITASKDRILPRDPESFLSTSPWQIMEFTSEQKQKSLLVEEAFRLHNVRLSEYGEVWTDGNEYYYRNKVEFSFWYDTEHHTLDLAFFRRGTHGKIAVKDTSLAKPAINEAARNVLEALRKLKVDGRSLKTLLVRCSKNNDVSWQLYVKDEDFDASAVLSEVQMAGVTCAEVIYSNPQSPASVITKKLGQNGNESLCDTILDVPFHYATEGFFQINIPVYEKALLDMQKWTAGEENIVDLYSGVGSIGLTIGGNSPTLVEINESAVQEMERNIKTQRSKAIAVLAPSEKALEYIQTGATVIVDPPRAGLHENVVERILETLPKKIIYLSCNPVTQARDVSRLLDSYSIDYCGGYNFFPRTPHIENLVVLITKP